MLGTNVNDNFPAGVKESVIFSAGQGVNNISVQYYKLIMW